MLKGDHIKGKKSDYDHIQRASHDWRGFQVVIEKNNLSTSTTDTIQCQRMSLCNRKKTGLPTTPTLSESLFGVLAAKLVRSSVRQLFPKQAAPLDLSSTSLEATILLFLAC